MTGFIAFSQEKVVELITVCNRQIEINTMEHSFGIINKGDKASFKFQLKNITDSVLVIKHVTTSCGCTSPEWTKKPVKANKKGIVKVIYDTNKLGQFNKSVYVYTNFQERPIHLKVRGNVIPMVTEKQALTKREFNIDGNLPQNQ